MILSDYMSSEDYSERVRSVFQDLKKRDMIDGTLKKSKKTANFKASLIFDKIYFNPKYKFDEDSLYFILLHEQGHKEDSKNTKNYVAFLSGIILMIYIPMYLLSSPFWTKLVASLFIIGFTVVTLNLYSKRFHKDEYKADEYAASKLDRLDKFDVEPHEVLEKLAGNYKEQKQDLNRLKKLLFKGVLHPPDEKRVEHLKECMKKNRLCEKEEIK